LWDIYEKYNVTAATWMHTPEVIRKRAETWKRNGNGKDVARLHTPEAITKSARNHQKPIEITFPNGLIGVYPCRKIAAAALGVCASCIGGWINMGQKVTIGKNKGYGARLM
jgi:hypothetical protein